jgi:hypothetical protein
MKQPSKQRPWHDLSLPVWHLGWLVACVAVGVSTAGTFGYALDRWGWADLALLIGMGFGITLVILTAAHAWSNRFETAPQGSGLFPPFWVRHTVLVATLVGIGVTLASRPRITTRPSSGSRMIAEGPEVVILGLLVIVSACYPSIRLLVRKPATWPRRIIGLWGLLMVVAGLAVAVHQLVVHSQLVPGQ